MANLIRAWKDLRNFDDAVFQDIYNSIRSSGDSEAHILLRTYGRTYEHRYVRMWHEVKTPPSNKKDCSDWQHQQTWPFAEAIRLRIIYSRKLSRKLFPQILLISRRWDFKIVLKTNDSIEIEIGTWFPLSFRFISFHVIPFHFSSFDFHFISFHFIFIWFLFHFQFHSIWFHNILCGFILFRFVSRDAENLAMTLHQKSSRVHWEIFFANPPRKRCGSDAEASRKPEP